MRYFTNLLTKLLPKNTKIQCYTVYLMLTPYSCINDIGKCDQLQIDLNSVYDWAHVNNMFFNVQKFNCVSFNGSMTPCGSNVLY